MKENILPKFSLLFISGLAITFFVLSIIGSINHYTPVPFWDMWDANVLFYTRLLDGDFPAWWTQHVNHRTIFSNVLFFLDHKYFNGHNIFLNVSHYILILALFLWFYFFSKELDEDIDPGVRLATLMVIFAVLFSWIQFKNITWAFQSMMFAAHLFPILAFYFLHKASASKISWVNYGFYFLLSLILGVTSAFTMMNGIIVLPLMIIMAIFCKIRPLHILLILFFAIVSLKFYFTGYFKPAGQGDMLPTLLDNPVGTFKFAFMLLGAPAYYMSSVAKEFVALITGIFLCLGFTYFLFRLLIYNLNRTLLISLIFVLIYEAGTVIGIASGRLIIGFDQAFLSRYMTTSLVIWALFILMFVYGMRTFFEKRPKAILIICLIPLLLLPYQIKALDKNVNQRFQMLGAALAVELDVKDKIQTNYIWPWIDSLFIMAGPAHKWDASILGHRVFKGLREKMSGDYTVDVAASKETCTVVFSKIEPAVENEKIYRLLGAQSPLRGEHIPERLEIVSEQNKIIGYMISENLVPRVGSKPLTQVPILGYATEIPSNVGTKFFHEHGYCTLSL